jgi:hypothetical protein
MLRSRIGPALALALLSQPAFPAPEAELAQIRDEIRALRESYEARIRTLEQRLNEAESRAAPARQAAAPAASAPAAASATPVAPSASTMPGVPSSSAFNPAISAILIGTYAHLSKDPAKFVIPGFTPEGEIGPGRRGFGLGESELVFTANVDPLFFANLTLAVTPEDTVEVEEAYGLFRAPHGLAPKFGRFLSGVGYLNEQHPHAWDFVDAPLGYQAFFGGHYGTDGVQVKWVAPTETFLELGGEVGNGDAYPGSERNRNGAGAWAAYAHLGGDVGDSHSWRAGVSYLDAKACVEAPTEEDPEACRDARSKLSIADFVWKWAPHGNIRERYVKVQGEYLSGKVRDQVRQSGWYLQGVWQFMPEWRVGARYDRLDPNGVDDASYAPRRASVMLDWNPSEFSRIRLQFARSEMLEGTRDNQFFVQYILSLGAHGAHRY